MTRPRKIDQLTLPLLRRILGVAEEAQPHHLLEAAAAVRGTVPQLVLTVARRTGAELGPGSTGLLARAAARAEDYRDLVGEVRRTVPGARVVKGSSLARHYPGDLLRPVGDVDLLVAGAPDIWRAAAAIVRARPVQDVAVVLHGPDRLPFVTLRWPPADPWLDRPMKAEIFATPLMGNAAAVGVRSLPAGLPSVLTDLLVLSEERFQRPFNVKDFADVLALADSELPSVPDVVAAAAECRLAPELAELLGATAEHCDIGDLGPVARVVAAAAGAELGRRAVWSRPPIDRSLPGPVWRWLAAGVPVPSVPLRIHDVPAEQTPARTEVFGDHVILRTPVGDFLATVHETVSADDYEGAIRHLAAAAG
ncbi:hypothetical protein MUY14_08745 [Amycolatopsis sp. FBCC-B4732]|uniref:hypothetical protein n=1 Tax=Amycolatopsis sp. FBCC-B4732 TaxID=3079339 RepID=UPI001FF47A2F|nr:hypothetical protein [Amycolatopsis sp. FBCC-B4732]UOX90696.1 hypothetical protein MUY14_08745 [Amycolatopsis sp. FBCC-B4732]